MQSQVKFNKVPEKVSEKAPVLGGFGAEPGHVQQGSGKGSGAGRALAQSQVKFINVRSQVRFNGFRRRLQNPNQVR